MSVYGTLADQPTPKKRRTALWIVGGVVAGLMLLCGIGAAIASGGDDTQSPVAAASSAASHAPASTPAGEPTTRAAATPSPTQKPAKKLTAEQEQAVGKAEDYLDYSHFSRKGLIKQLEFEGFTAAQAKHGATGAGL